MSSTSSMKFPDTLWPQQPQTKVTNNTFRLRLPIGRLSPAGPRPQRTVRRTPRHSPASSTCSITSADFWAPPSDNESEPDTPATSDDESPVPVLSTPTPKRRAPKPANIIIPKEPIRPRPESLVLSPCSPLSPMNVNSPNARVRKLAKLTRTLGENVPVELVFPSTAPYLLTSPTSPVRFAPSPAQDYEPPTPTPVRQSPGTTAVGLHYALGMHTAKRAAAFKQPVPAPAAATSPPPFTHAFTMDAQSWDRARDAALAPPAPKTKAKKSRMRGILPKLDTGRGTWRKKENTWSGEWNIEDMHELQVRLRLLRR
ncbi:hypothetical protein HMN09_01192400 [Mycena chlorophos]|uniref:Uncharacterized protein n=1 Tax=Mycena chlorophos TaxID=658473 RepID=A0A8H6VTB3_MYCCL|nr:hypothetical protein HMN09_01192400 [Mycena chlorophos]